MLCPKLLSWWFRTQRFYCSSFNSANVYGVPTACQSLVIPWWIGDTALPRGACAPSLCSVCRLLNPFSPRSAYPSTHRRVFWNPGEMLRAVPDNEEPPWRSLPCLFHSSSPPSHPLLPPELSSPPTLHPCYLDPGTSPHHLSPRLLQEPPSGSSCSLFPESTLPSNKGDFLF